MTYVSLRNMTCAKEVNVRFDFVNVQATCCDEGVEKKINGFGFLNRGFSHEHGVIHKLLVRLGIDSMGGQTFKIL